MKDLITMEKLLTIIGFLVVLISGYMAQSVDKMASSVSELNIRVAIVIEKLSNHENRLIKLEDKRGK